MLPRNSNVGTPNSVGPGNQWGKGKAIFWGTKREVSNPIPSMYPDCVSQSYLGKHVSVVVLWRDWVSAKGDREKQTLGKS